MTQYKATSQGQVPMTAQEEADFLAAQAAAQAPRVPAEVSFRKAKTQLQLAGMWDGAIAAANAIADSTQRIKMLGLLLDSAVYERNRPELVSFAKNTLGLTDAQIDQLFIDADKL